MPCLDSTFLIDLSREHKGAVLRAARMKEEGESVMTTAPVFTEVMLGAHHRGAAYLTRTAELFESVEVVPVDELLADEAARLGGAQLRRGVSLGAVDLSVAALAIRRHQSVISNDPDFGRVAGLAVETY